MGHRRSGRRGDYDRRRDDRTTAGIATVTGIEAKTVTIMVATRTGVVVAPS